MRLDAAGTATILLIERNDLMNPKIIYHVGAALDVNVCPAAKAHLLHPAGAGFHTIHPRN